MEKHRGQAALEFLMTYSWALIMILIMIAAIVYFGVTKPKDILPNRCLFSPEMQCLAYTLTSADNSFKIRLKNNVGDMITVTGMDLISDDSSDFICATKPSNPANWPHATSKDLTFANCNLGAVGFTSGRTVKLFLNMSYYPLKGGPTYENRVVGEILTKVS